MQAKCFLTFYDELVTWVVMTHLKIFTEFNTTEDGWLQWRGKQYFLNMITKSMEEAREFCKKKRGDLASINSKEESIFLWKQVSIVSLPHITFKCPHACSKTALIPPCR